MKTATIVSNKLFNRSNNFFLFTLFFMILMTYSAFSAGIPGAVHEWKDHKYVVVTAYGGSWDYAASDVVSTVGPDYYLATITSQEEQDFVASLLNASGSAQYWIGGIQNPIGTTDANANWTWVTGEPWCFTSWGPSEPNDWSGPAAEQYIAMRSDYSWDWNDEIARGYSIRGYVAELGSSRLSSLCSKGAVIATAFYDANENGLVDEGEKAVTDAIVRHPEGDKTTKHYTLQNGRAVFNNLAEGVQSFYVDMNSLPNGTQSTTENSVQVTLSPELNLVYLWFGFSGDLADRLGDDVVVPDDQSNDKCNPLVFVKGSPTYSDGKNSYGWENAVDCDFCSEAGATYAMADPATGDSAPWAVYEFVDKSTRQFDYVKFQSGFCQDPGNDRQDGLSKSQSMGYRVRKIEVLVSTTGMDAANFTSVGVFKDKYSEHELQWNKLASAVQAKYVKLRLLDPVVDGMYTQIVEFEVDNSDKTGAQPAREAGRIAAVESAGLLSNYPNPFNPSTTIQYHLDEAAQVSLKVYDVTGKLVAELANEFVTAGSHIVTWNAADMPSGVYFVTMQSGAQSATRRLLLMK